VANENENNSGTQVIVDDTLNNNGNTDNSTDVEIEDSFNTDTEVEVENSFNDSSTNLELEVEFEDSFNDNSRHDNSVRNQDSFNVTSSFNTQTLNDHSTTVGIRQYQAGFGDFNVDAALAGGKYGAAAGKYGAASGDINLDNRSLQLDQSVNQIIETGGGWGSGNVGQVFGQNATVAFGDGSQAAGHDINIDNSSMSLNLGDIAIGNTDISTRINDAFNDQSQNFDMEWELEIEDSFNDYSTHTDVEVEIEDSFTSEVDAAFENSYEWENSGNIFSPGAASTGGETEFDF
jgi:hypothetical protein